MIKNVLHMYPPRWSFALPYRARFARRKTLVDRPSTDLGKIELTPTGMPRILSDATDKSVDLSVAGEMLYRADSQQGDSASRGRGGANVTTTPPVWLTLPEDEFQDHYRPERAVTRSYLHRVLLRALGRVVGRVPAEDELQHKPLVIDLVTPLPSRLRFYVYAATQHASERQQGTFKVQLTKGVSRPGSDSSRLYFDRTGNIRPVLIGYHTDWRLFILWDADLHDLSDGFPYSKNVQAPPDIVWGALARGLARGTRRLKKPAVTETIVACRPRRLVEALELRIRSSNQALFEGACS